MRTAPGIGPERAAREGLVRAARRFAATLVAWLYGDRERTRVEPTSPEVQLGLTRAPPYIPPGQRGRGDGYAERVEIALQARTAGVLTVAIRDSRTSYPVSAGFELRARTWQIVHLNTH